jgi:hypothetical protein
LFLSGPNDQWIDFQERQGQLDMPPNHVGRWNRRAFETIGRRHGWELAEHRTEPVGRVRLLRSTAEARFFHARHVAGSLTDRTTRIRSRPLRRLCSLPMLAVWHVSAIGQAVSQSPSRLGPTQWAHLRRVGGS